MKIFNIYQVHRSLLVVGAGIESLELNYGCDGSRHATAAHTLYMDKYGNVCSGRDHGTVVTGACDGSCKRQHDIGSFSLRADEPQVEMTEEVDEYCARCGCFIEDCWGMCL